MDIKLLILIGELPQKELVKETLPVGTPIPRVGETVSVNYELYEVEDVEYLYLETCVCVHVYVVEKALFSQGK